ncbi:hypothetical protein HGB13_04910 [bacterium]|nr:hypothetical protein [bacterium]
MDENNLDELKSNLNKHHDSLSAEENQGNHFVIQPPEISTPFMANAVQQAQVHNDPVLQNQLGLNKKPLNKEKLIKIGIVAGSISLVILLSWLGYRWYQRSSDEKILKEAAKNLITTRDLHSKATIGIEGFSLSFDLYIDKDQDMKAAASIMGEGSAELLWFPEKDNAFAGMNYGYEESEKLEYIRLTNVKKTIENYNKISEDYCMKKGFNIEETKGIMDLFITYLNGKKKTEKIPAFKSYDIAYVGRPGFSIEDLAR